MKNLFSIKLMPVFCIPFLLASCFEIDNYDLPKETLTGVIIDKNTGKPLQTQTYDCMINLEETSWSDNPTPLKFSSKPDGTFMNSKVFMGTYIVTPVDGPFIPVEGKTVEIKGVASVSFEVEPYLNVSVTNLKQTGSTVTLDFKISSSSDKYKVTDAQVFVANTPFVGDGASIVEFKQGFDFNDVSNADVYSTIHHAELTNLKSKRSYFIRVGARVNDPSSRKYNYSEVSGQITVP